MNAKRIAAVCVAAVLPAVAALTIASASPANAASTHVSVSTSASASNSSQTDSKRVRVITFNGVQYVWINGVLQP